MNAARQAAERFVLGLLCALPAAAQCPLGWTGLPEIPTYLSDWSAMSATVFNAGDGARLYTAGYFTGGILPGPYGALARWEGDRWSVIEGEADAIIWTLSRFDDGSGPAIYAFGRFTEIDLPRSRIATRYGARWDAAGWHALPIETNGNWWPRDTAVFDDGSGAKLYLGGWFGEINGVVVNGIARWDGVRWDSLDGGVTLGGGAGLVGALAVHDDGSGPALYAAGSFDRAGSENVSVVNVARWDGQDWSAVGGGLPGSTPIPQVQCLASYDDGSGPALYAGGLFQTSQFRRLARWNGFQWRPASGEEYPDASVQALCVFDQGEGPELYASGRFTAIGAQPFEHVARWNGSRWAGVGGGLPYGSMGWARIIPFDDGLGPALFAYGDFETPFAKNIARWGCLRGDLNCDEAVNAADIEPFILALLDPVAYSAAFPDCNRELADMNADGDVDVFDIDGFVRALP